MMLAFLNLQLPSMYSRMAQRNYAKAKLKILIYFSMNMVKLKLND